MPMCHYCWTTSSQQPIVVTKGTGLCRNITPPLKAWSVPSSHKEERSPHTTRPAHDGSIWVKRGREGDWCHTSLFDGTGISEGTSRRHVPGSLLPAGSSDHQRFLPLITELRNDYAKATDHFSAYAPEEGSRSPPQPREDASKVQKEQST